MTRQIILSGTGGQGIILAGIILAEAAVLEGRQAVQVQSYGPEARGGASKSEVIISDDVIDYPKVILADALLAMSQEACDRYLAVLKKGGQLIVDTAAVGSISAAEADILALPLTETARLKLGNAMFANIIALGALTDFSQAVGREALAEALMARAPKGTAAINRRALETGFALKNS